VKVSVTDDDRVMEEILAVAEKQDCRPRS